MANDDLGIHKESPPETPEDWQRVHRAVYRVEQSWPIIAPLVAILKNGRAWLVGGAIYIFLMRDDVSDLIAKIVGVE